MKALIVEPSRVVSSTLTGLFARYGIHASSVPSANDALASLEDDPVDMLCFAYELGDMNGIDFFVSAKARKLLHHQPALLFSATHDKRLVDMALQAGVTECFSKRQLTQLEQFVEKFSASNRPRITGHVLLVEDSPTTAMFYRQILVRMGLTVDICNTAEAAIETFDRNAYDLVITDYVLAGTETGFAVLRAVRATPGRKSATPVLTISSFDDTARKVEVLRNGANDYVTKPVIAEELEVRITNLLKVQHLMRRLESQHEAMKTMAMHDQLTSLYNRHYLEVKTAALLDDAQATGTPLSLLMIDIDHFKRVNDTYGHKAGDHVLESVARTMQRFAGPTDIVARVGGEEFVIVMPGIPLADAAERAEELRETVSRLNPADLPVTVSIGVAMLATGELYDDLFRRADEAAYVAKGNGRNVVEVAG